MSPAVIEIASLHDIRNLFWVSYRQNIRSKASAIFLQHSPVLADKNGHFNASFVLLAIS